MTWLGRRKLAFVPVHRPNAHPPDEGVPADWPNQILRRVLFDPDPTTKTDRSLRAYVHAASSGRADLDAVVMPTEVLDQQDVPVNALEGRLGSFLRGSGFDAAALVMLGQPPTGTSMRGGFWARFDMSEGIGVWAMELMHCLTGMDDLYPFGGNMGAFDEMACSCGTHPSAYTKAAIGWLDRSAIAAHVGRIGAYDLHSVGLVQPPPSGRFAAVRIGSTVPYLMVEARQRVDQFDHNVPGEGVIVYRVQTSDPLGHAENQSAPVELLTVTTTGGPAPLAVGQLFTEDSGITVRVVTALAGGFSIRIEDPSQMPVSVPYVLDDYATSASKELRDVGLVPRFIGMNLGQVVGVEPVAGGGDSREQGHRRHHAVAHRATPVMRRRSTRDLGRGQGPPHQLGWPTGA